MEQALPDGTVVVMTMEDYYLHQLAGAIVSGDPTGLIIFSMLAGGFTFLMWKIFWRNNE